MTEQMDLTAFDGGEESSENGDSTDDGGVDPATGDGCDETSAADDAVTTPADEATADVEALPMEPDNPASCPFCMAPPAYFRRRSATGRIGCSNCDATIAVDTDWYNDGDKIASIRDAATYWVISST